MLMVVVLLPGIICPPVTVKPPSPVEENPDVKPVQEDVVCSSSLSRSGCWLDLTFIFKSLYLNASTD